MPRTARSPEQFVSDFWASVDKESCSPCWKWKGYIDRSHGRGMVSWRNRTTMASRVAWELARNQLPPKLFNTCGNLWCVNPEHYSPRPPKDGTPYIPPMLERLGQAQFPDLLVERVEQARTPTPKLGIGRVSQTVASLPASRPELDPPREAMVDDSQRFAFLSQPGIAHVTYPGSAMVFTPWGNFWKPTLAEAVDAATEERV